MLLIFNLGLDCDTVETRNQYDNDDCDETESRYIKLELWKSIQILANRSDHRRPILTTGSAALLTGERWPDFYLRLSSDCRRAR